MNTNLLTVAGLEIHSPEKRLCGPLSFTLNPGDRLGILGQNGTGKTTLLHTLMGLQPVRQGRVQIGPRPLDDWRGQQLAQQIGILFQAVPDEMPATVYEAVMLGRLPYARHWQWENDEDHTIVQQALRTMELDHLSSRDINHLSGGERQRMAIAALIAQRPRILLLDEPSNHLDISFQIKALRHLAETVTGQDRAMIMATHDINLAARFCNRILLLRADGKHLLGSAGAVLDADHLSAAFQCQVAVVSTGSGPVYYPVV